MKHFVVAISSLFFCSSCAVVSHMEEAGALQAYSKEQDALHTMVRERDNKFDGLLARIASGDKLGDLNNRAALLSRLGEPILTEPIEEGGIKKERWLYRYQKPIMDQTKVYFVVNMNGGVDRWYEAGPPGTATPSTDDPGKK